MALRRFRCQRFKNTCVKATLFYYKTHIHPCVCNAGLRKIMKVSMFKKIFVFLMLSVAFGVDVPVKNQNFEKYELVQGNGDKHVVHAIEGAVLAGSEVPDAGKVRELKRGVGK